MFSRSVTWPNLGVFPFRAASRAGAAVPVTYSIWAIRSTLSSAGVSPMAESTLSQNL